MDDSADDFTTSGSPRTLVQQLEHEGGRLAAAAYALLRDDAHPTFVAAAEPGLVLLRSGFDQRAVIVVEADRLAKQGILTTWVRGLAGSAVDVVFLGDRPVDPGVARGLGRRWPAPAVAVYRVDSRGERHGIGRMPTALSPAARVLTAPWPSPTPEDWARVALDRRSVERAAREEIERLQAFAETLRARRPVATWTLAAVLIAVFVVTFVVAGGIPLWALNRLGALDTARILAGEYYRLVSCTFLHGDIVHLLFNTFVLVALGTSLERIVGSWRFIAIYGLSGLVGSIVSAWRLSEGGISVGASGAIWGIMAAEVLLVLSPKSPLPPSLRDRARNGVLANIALNVLNSFRPHVDFAAHFGGGVAGLLVAAFLLRGHAGVGHAGVGHAGVGHAGVGHAPPAKPSSSLRAVGSMLLAFYVGSLALAMAHAAPWRYLLAAESVSLTVAPLKVRATIPTIIADELRDVSTEAGPEVTFGAVDTSPVVIGLKVDRFDVPLLPDSLDAEAEATVAALKSEPGDGPALDVSFERVGDEVTVVAVAELRNGLYYEKCFRFDTEKYVAAESLVWAEGRNQWRGIARRVAESVEFGVVP